MAQLDDINTQLKLAFYEKEGNEFEKFVVSAYKISYPNLLAVKPQGSKGDGANDGYASHDLVLQIYAPDQVDAKKTIEKINHDFERAKISGWNFKKWHWVIIAYFFDICDIGKIK